MTLPKLNIKTASELAMAIEDIVWEKDVSYIDAIVHYCERMGVEIESVGQAIRSNSNLKAKIQNEAEDLHFFEKTSKLPI
jgi:Phage late-transcription coactivator